eukprot:12483148-Heterocapsa_arctica.AAC.1
MLKLWWRDLKEAANIDDNIAKLLPQGWITLSSSHVLDSFKRTSCSDMRIHLEHDSRDTFTKL